MRHSLHAEGFGIRLRPVCLEDAAFLAWLRNQDYVKGRVGDSASDIPSQEKWLQAYLQRSGDYYFIAETRCGIPVGTDSIYNISGNSGERGRHITRLDVMAAVPAAILSAELAFRQLQLDELTAHVVSTNTAVLSLKRKLGYQQVGVKCAAQIIGGKPVDLVQFVLTREKWERLSDGLISFAAHAERQISQWDAMQVCQPNPWGALLVTALSITNNGGL